VTVLQFNIAMVATRTRSLVTVLHLICGDRIAAAFIAFSLHSALAYRRTELLVNVKKGFTGQMKNA